MNKGNVEIGKKKQKKESGLYTCLIKEDCEHKQSQWKREACAVTSFEKEVLWSKRKELIM